QIPLCFMGDEGQLTTPFPFFVDVAGKAAERIRADRYEQMRTTFNQPDVADGDLPDPNDPDTFRQATLPWDAYEAEPGRKALERFRQLAELRRDLVWPLAASPCLDARSSRTGSALIVTWAFAAGHLTMALNPASSPV